MILILGALQYVAAKCLLREDRSNDRYLCINMSTLDVDIKDARCTVVNCFAKDALASAWKYSRLFFFLKRLMRKAARISIYVPHIYHAVGNFLAFECAHERIYLISDGLLNYYRCEVGKGIHDQAWKKAAVSRVLGARYRKYTGHLTGCDVIDYDGCYVFDARGVVTAPDRVIELSVRAAPVVAGEERVLFLDQPLEYLPGEHHMPLKAAIRRYLACCSNIYYKGHREQIGASVDDLAGLDAVVLDSSLAAELLIERYQITRVVSMMGTALLTISKLFPDVHCVSIGMNRFVQVNPELKTAAQVISELGVEVIDA